MPRFGQKAQRKVCGFLGPLFGSYLQELTGWNQKLGGAKQVPSGKEKWEGGFF